MSEVILRLNYRDLTDDELSDLLMKLCGDSGGKIYCIEKVKHDVNDALDKTEKKE